MFQVTAFYIIAAVIIFIGFAGQLILKKTGFPDVLSLILFGILLGPVFGVFPRESMIPLTPYVVTLSLMMILFYGGLQMDMGEVFGQSGRAMLLTLTNLTLVTIGVAFFVRHFFDFSWIQALMFGPMVTGTSAAVIIPLSERHQLRRDTFLTISLESVLDFINVVVFLAFTEFLKKGNLSFEETGKDIAASFGVGILIGFVVGVVWLRSLYHLREEKNTYMATLGVLALTFVGSEFLGGNGALSALVLGLVIGNEGRISSFIGLELDSSQFAELKTLLMRLQSELAFLVRSFFFIFLGLIYNVSYTVLKSSLILGLALLAIILFMRFLAVSLSTLGSPMSTDRVPMTLLCGQGLAQATMSVIPYQLGLPNPEIFSITVVTVILLTNMVTSVGSVMASRMRKKPSEQID